MVRILDNPREFFENLTEEEFKKLLDEYDIEYVDMKGLNQQEKDQLIREFSKDN